MNTDLDMIGEIILMCVICLASILMILVALQKLYEHRKATKKQLRNVTHLVRKCQAACGHATALYSLSTDLNGRDKYKNAQVVKTNSSSHTSNDQESSSRVCVCTCEGAQSTSCSIAVITPISNSYVFEDPNHRGLNPYDPNITNSSLDFCQCQPEISIPSPPKYQISEQILDDFYMDTLENDCNMVERDLSYIDLDQLSVGHLQMNLHFKNTKQLTEPSTDGIEMGCDHSNFNRQVFL